MEDKTLRMAMLLDFYGELLTDKQRSCFDMYYNENLSLSEIAEIEGITRQGVRDMLLRSETALEDAEEKLGILKREKMRGEAWAKAVKALEALVAMTQGEAAEKAAEALDLVRRMEEN